MPISFQYVSSWFLNELTDEASTTGGLRKTIPIVDCSLTEELLSESESTSEDIQSQAVSSSIVMSRCQSEKLCLIHDLVSSPISQHSVWSIITAITHSSQAWPAADHKSRSWVTSRLTVASVCGSYSTPDAAIQNHMNQWKPLNFHHNPNSRFSHVNS